MAALSAIDAGTPAPAIRLPLDPAPTQPRERLFSQELGARLDLQARSSTMRRWTVADEAGEKRAPCTRGADKSGALGQLCPFPRLGRLVAAGDCMPARVAPVSLWTDTGAVRCVTKAFSACPNQRTNSCAPHGAPLTYVTLSVRVFPLGGEYSCNTQSLLPPLSDGPTERLIC